MAPSACGVVGVPSSSSSSGGPCVVTEGPEGTGCSHIRARERRKVSRWPLERSRPAGDGVVVEGGG